MPMFQPRLVIPVERGGPMLVSFFGNLGFGEVVPHDIAQECNLFYKITDTGRNWTLSCVL